MAYIVYKLMCLKDPSRYYGKPSGDAIDIINVAINAKQAKNVFFKGFQSKIKNCPWFEGKFYAKTESIEFDKAITVHSGHSERESHEGLNLFVAVLDEISGFALEGASASSKSSDAIYKAFRGTVDSRFAEVGKVVLLSFPRYKGDYVSQKYDEAIAAKETIDRHYTFKIDEELPNGVEGNEFTITWEEDRIVSYSLPNVYALKRPTWEVNPTVKIDNLKNAFYSDPEDALGRFACLPPDAIDGYFKDMDKLNTAFRLPPAAVEGSALASWFNPNDDHTYYMHVDLAQKHDRCALALAHVDSWHEVTFNFGSNYVAPKVVIDLVYWWTPRKDKNVDFKEVKEFIMNIKRMGFKLELVTFDRWNSVTMMSELNSVGINTETLSVAKKHYDDMKMAIMEERVLGPDIELLKKEIRELKITRDKIDHPRGGGGSKDLSDATCGAFFNAMSLTPRDLNKEVSIITLGDFERTQQINKNENNVIRPPMPAELSDYMSRITSI